MVIDVWYIIRKHLHLSTCLNSLIRSWLHECEVLTDTKQCIFSKLSLKLINPRTIVLFALGWRNHALNLSFTCMSSCSCLCRNKLNGAIRKSSWKSEKNPCYSKLGLSKREKNMSCQWLWKKTACASIQIPGEWVKKNRVVGVPWSKTTCYCSSPHPCLTVYISVFKMSTLGRHFAASLFAFTTHQVLNPPPIVTIGLHFLRVNPAPQHPLNKKFWHYKYPRSHCLLSVTFGSSDTLRCSPTQYSGGSLPCTRTYRNLPGWKLETEWFNMLMINV